MFITQPRPKKDGLGPAPSKKRKATYAIEEISFDNAARSEYLTGFHKRKVQRQKAAAEIAQEKARLEKISMRKQMREQRQKDVEEHVRQVNEALRLARIAGGEEVEDEEGDDDDDEWNGIEDDGPPEFVDHEEEYIDEDRYTTVTVEAVDVDREGMHRLGGNPKDDSDAEAEDAEKDEGDDGEEGDGKSKAKKATESGKEKKKEWPKKKKKKFRYESKIERQLSKQKQRRR